MDVQMSGPEVSVRSDTRPPHDGQAPPERPPTTEMSSLINAASDSRGPPPPQSAPPRFPPPLSNPPSSAHFGHFTFPHTQEQPWASRFGRFPERMSDLEFNASSSSKATPPPSNTTTSLLPPPPPPRSGGEIDRIRLAKAVEQQELESRRPDYLQRAKRDSDTPTQTEFSDAPSHPSVGILESPNKGRRITLFQETSEESFEESLMAGGYGRYRTAEWVRQPQPVLVAPGSAGPSKILSALEKAEAEEPPPMTAKEFKKRKRLEAFKSDGNHYGSSTLFPVELEGKGRVLLDIPNESLVVDSPRKRTARRKKKGEVTSPVPPAPEEHLDSPNWVDAEFPWRLRTEERTEIAKAEERARLQVIEVFLERDTDDEDEEDRNGTAAADGEDAVIPSSKWGLVYDNVDNRPMPARMGRGKMIPLAADPATSTATNLSMERRRRSYFPSDPADARAALLSKRNVRTLSYRREKRLRGVGHTREEDQLCVCRGTDDGRELVQCDDCKMWYHLQCLGIGHHSELGPEQQPWYCFDCHTGSRASSPELDDVDTPYREPTFAPTDETPRIRRTYDTPFFQSSGLQDSPLPAWNTNRLPRTPVRGGRDSDIDTSFSSRSESRYDSMTPHRPFDDQQFDPTSTPSRGSKVGGGAQGAFATPKTTLFGGVRSNPAAFQTPSRRRPSGGNMQPRMIAFPPSMDESPGSYGRFPVSGFHFDDSPVSRTGRRGSFDHHDERMHE